MERKRREIAWKSRDKVDNMKNRSSITLGKPIVSKDGKAQLVVRRSARILERKSQLDHSHRVSPDGNNVDNHIHLARSRRRSLAAPSAVWHGISVDPHSAAS